MDISQSEVRRWTEPGPPDQVLRALASRVGDAKGRVSEQTPNRLTASFGSRLAYRIFGALMPPGPRVAPIRLVIEIAADPWGSAVTATASSDPGWYAVNTPLNSGMYERKLRQLLDRVARGNT